MFDTVDEIRSFDPDWQPPPNGLHRVEWRSRSIHPPRSTSCTERSPRSVTTGTSSHGTPSGASAMRSCTIPTATGVPVLPEHVSAVGAPSREASPRYSGQSSWDSGTPIGPVRGPRPPIARRCGPRRYRNHVAATRTKVSVGERESQYQPSRLSRARLERGSQLFCLVDRCFELDECPRQRLSGVRVPVVVAGDSPHGQRDAFEAPHRFASSRR